MLIFYYEETLKIILHNINTNKIFTERGAAASFPRMSLHKKKEDICGGFYATFYQFSN